MSALQVPPQFRRGGHRSTERWLDSGEALLRYMADEIGVDDLSEVSVLDVGCGTKLVATLLDRALPIKHYAGADVDASLIDWLRAEVDDPRFEFVAIAAGNARYAPEGPPLPSISDLPVEGAFDLIAMWSVLTHLDPVDFAFILEACRRHVLPDGYLLASVFLHENSESGHGLLDALDKSLGGLSPPDSGYADLDPAEPLKWAVYTRARAVDLATEAGWRVEAIREPTWYAQHVLVLRPS